MYLIDYKGKDFSINVDTTQQYEREDFTELVAFLKSIYLNYNQDEYYWVIPHKRIDEIILWMSYKGCECVITPTAEAEINKFRNSFRKETTFLRSASIDYSVLKESKSLFNYQVEGVEWLLKRNRAYLTDDAGLGKTAQSIITFSQWYKENKIDSVFIIVRNGLSYGWKREILEFSNVFKEEDIVLITNENKVKPFLHITDKKIIIVPNHLVADMFASYRADYTRSKALSNIRWKEFVNIKEKWNKKTICLIIDEAHEFKNTKAVKTKAIMSHKEFFDYRILLSATPAINRFEDWWTGLYLIDEGILPYSENAFKILISSSIGNQWSPYNILSYNGKRIDSIRRQFSLNVLKRLKKDLPEVKTKQDLIPIYLHMTNEQEHLYKTFINSFVHKLEEEYDKITFKLILDKFPYVLQIIDNPLLLIGKVVNDKVNNLLTKWKFEKDPRVEYLKSALNDYIDDQKEKIIIFDNHPKTLDALAEIFKKYNPCVIHGGLKDTPEQRQKKIDVFNDKNSDCKIFLINTQIGGAGFNLQYACRRIIFYTLPFDTTLFRQAIDRVYRVTSEWDSIVELLIMDGTVDNIRYKRNIDRTFINDEILNRDLSEHDLENLFLGLSFTN